MNSVALAAVISQGIALILFSAMLTWVMWHVAAGRVLITSPGAPRLTQVPTPAMDELERRQAAAGQAGQEGNPGIGPYDWTRHHGDPDDGL